MRTQVRSLALLSESEIRHCCELWCGSQTRLRSGVAVAGATPVALIRPLAWDLLYASSAALKSKQTNKQNKKLSQFSVFTHGDGVCLPGLSGEPS